MSAIYTAHWLFLLLGTLCISQRAACLEAFLSSGDNAEDSISCFQIFRVKAGDLQLVDTMEEKPCPPQSSCMLVDATTSMKIADEIEAPGTIVYGSCVPTFACGTLTCTQILSAASVGSFMSDSTITGCQAGCCHGNLCNGNNDKENNSLITTVPVFPIPDIFPNTNEEDGSTAESVPCGYNRTITEEEISQNAIGTIFGNITSPNYPEPYHSNAKCFWTVFIPPEYVLIVDVIVLKVESCCDLLTVTTKEGSSQHISISNTYILQTEAATFQFNSDRGIIDNGFVLQYTVVKQNVTMVEEAESSGGESTPSCKNVTMEFPEVGDTKVITSPEWPLEYPRNLECSWWIIGPPEAVILAEVLAFTTETCCDKLMFGNESGALLHTLSGFVRPGTRFYSSGNILLVGFFTDGNEQRNGFSLKFTAVDPVDKEEFERLNLTSLPVATTNPTSCGGELNATGEYKYFSSTGYPLHYLPLQTCIWMIVAPPGLFVELSAESVEVELCCDHLQLSEPDLAPRSIATDSVYVAGGNKLQVNFTSDQSIQRSGFRLKYRTVNDTVLRQTECGYKDHLAVVGVDKHLVSPNYPEHYDNSLNCVYIFRAPAENYRIRFRLISFHTEICCDKLNLYDSDVDPSSSSPGISVSGTVENIPTMYSNTSVLTVLFFTDPSVNYRGFDIVYTAIEASQVPTTSVNIWTPPTSLNTTFSEICGVAERATNVTQYIRSPGYPQLYSNYLTCEWEIEAPEDYGITLQFGNSSTESCCDRVEILEGRSTTLAPQVFKGNFPDNVFIINKSYIKVRFITDFATRDIGFELAYRTISRDLIPTQPSQPETDSSTKSGILPTTQQPVVSNPSESCVYSRKATDVTQTITSPGWPEKYFNNLKCEWILTTRLGYHVQLTFQSFRTEQCCDFISIDDGEFTTPRLNNRNVMILSPFFSKGNVLKLRFQSDASVPEAGFQATFNEIEVIPEPLLPNIGACGFIEEAKDDSSPLYSPNWPHYYEASMDCFWTIQAPPGRQVAITFQKFNTEKCCDFLKLEDDEAEIADLRGDLLVPVTYQTTKGPLRLHFKSDLSFQRPGFEASYALIEIPDLTTRSNEMEIQGSGYFTNAPVVERIRCYTGVKLIGVGLNRDHQTLTECPPDSACLGVSSTVVTQTSGFEVEMHMTTSRCVPRSDCAQYTCEQVKSVLPPGTPTDFRDCSSRCCYTDMCNSPDNIDISSIPTTIQTAHDVTTPKVTTPAPAVATSEDTVEVVSTLDSVTNGPEITKFSTVFAEATSAGVSTAVLPAICGYNATSSARSKDLYSPGWPDPYAANLSCDWFITASPGKQVQLQFISLYTEACCDYIKITDVGGAHVDDIRGNSPPSTSIVSTHGVLHLRFVSDRSIERNGFHIRFLDADIEGISPAPCGFDKVATYAPQNLYSPGFPQVYRNSLRCEWRITAPEGKTIHVNFTYFDTENCCDYLLIYDYGREVADIRGRNLPNRTVSSASNQLILRFFSDSSLPGNGFQSTFQIAGEGVDVTTDEPPVPPIDPHKVVTLPLTTTSMPPARCGFTSAAHDFTQPLNSPGWPGSYSANQQCEWRLTASDGKQVQLDFTYVDLEECCDTVEIADTFTLLGVVKKVSHTQFKSTSGLLVVRFKSDGTVQKKGFQAVFRETDSLDTGPAPCGFVATAKSQKQTLNSPGWPGHYSNKLECTWTIYATPGKQVSLEFTSINVEECCDLVKVLENGNEIVALKGEILPENPYVITSTSGSLTVRFTSDFSVVKPGFEALFYDAEDSNAIPEDEKPTAISDKHVKTTLKTDYTVSSTTTSTVQAAAEGSSCGSELTATENFQTLTSPNHPEQYGANLSCSWVIRALDNNAYVMLRLDYIDTETCCDYLLIYDGTTRVARIGGTRLPLENFVSRQNYVNLTFVSDTSVHATGFRLSYKLSKTEGAALTTLPPATTTPAILCGYNLTLREEEVSSFTSPGWPAAYWNNALCLWKFTAPLGLIMQINFTTFDTEKCCDHLWMQETGLEEKRLDGVFEQHTVFRTVTNEVTFLFKSDGSIARAGFEGIITADEESQLPEITVQTTTPTQSLTPTINVGRRCSSLMFATGNWQSISSSGWPLQYPINYQCEWTIESRSEDLKIRFKFAEIDLCCDDTLTIYDDGKIVDSPITAKVLRNPLSIPRFYVSKTNRINIQMKTYGPRAATGFRLDYKIDALPILPCGSVTYLADPSIIQSPNYPENYPDGLSCAWTLDAPFGDQVVLNISSLDTEECCDYVQITDGPDNRLITRLKGPRIGENIVFRSSTNLMTVTFYSDSSTNRAGFRATAETRYATDYDPGACGFTAVATDRKEFFHSTNYPNEYPSGLDCYWLIRSPFPNRQIELHMHDFKSEECCDFLKIYDGNNLNSHELGNIRNRPEARFYQSTSSSLFLHFRSDASVNFRGFNVSFNLVKEDIISTTQQTLAPISPSSGSDGKGRECLVGVRITRSGVDLDSRNWTRCERTASCLSIFAAVYTSHTSVGWIAHLTVGQCVPSDQCRSYQCSTIQSYLPPEIPGVIRGCSKECCNADGRCLSEANSEDIDINVPSIGKGEGDSEALECKIGEKLSGSGFDRDQQRLTRCNSDQACSELSTTLSANVGGIATSVEIVEGQCVAADQCTSIGCDRLQRYFPRDFPGRMTGCSTQCCFLDGSCAISSDGYGRRGRGETGVGAGESESVGERVECRVGARISENGIVQDHQISTRCISDQVCSKLSTHLTANIAGNTSSVDVSLHQCVGRDQCFSLGCEQLQNYVPADLSARMTDCSVECCYADGSCAASSARFDGGLGGVSVEVPSIGEGQGVGEGVECKIGQKVSRDGIDQDQQRLTRCNSGQVCSKLSSSLSAIIEGRPSTVEVSLHQCVSRDQCYSFGCDQLLSSIPTNFPAQLTGCSTECCSADGSCSASSLGFDPRFGGGSPAGIGFECRVGINISGDGSDRDEQRMAKCLPEQSCAEFVTTLSFNTGNRVLSANFNVGQCLSSSDCASFGCDHLRGFIPESIPISFNGCHKRCCTSAGECSLYQLAAERMMQNVTVPSTGEGEAVGEGVECKIGVKISGKGNDRDQQALTTCSFGQACSQLSTSLSANVEGLPSTVEVSLRQCVWRDQCYSSGCLPLLSYIPADFSAQMTGCTTECCFADGSCHASSLSFNNSFGGGSLAATGNGFECTVGIKISGERVNQNEQRLAKCHSEQICSQFSTTISANVGNRSVSADLIMGQCLTLAECEARQCEHLRSYIPGTVSITFNGCHKRCCTSSGVCSESGTSPERPTQNPSATDNGGLECTIGIKISGNGNVQDDQETVTCSSNKACSQISTTIIARVDGVSASADVSVGQCVLPAACQEFSCDIVRSFLPLNFSGDISSCSKQCCFPTGECTTDSIDRIVVETLDNSSVAERSKDNLRCYVGVAISNSYFFENSQEEQDCNTGSSCLHVEASVYDNNVANSSQVSVGLCVSTYSCHLITCERIKSYIPALVNQSITSCQSRCCNDDLCNSPIIATSNNATEISGSQTSGGEVANSGFTNIVDGSEQTECLNKDVAFLPGCTFRQYYMQYALCSTLFYNDYPYNDIEVCGINIQLFQACAAGLKKRCLQGDRSTLFGQNSERQMADALINATIIWEPAYEVFCEKKSDEINLPNIGTSSFVTSMSSISGLCNRERIDDMARSISKAAQDLLYAERSMDACQAYDDIKSVTLQIFDSCDFSKLPTSALLSDWILKTTEIVPELLNSFNLPKCAALRVIEELRPSKPTMVTPDVFSTPDSHGCWSYNMDIMFLLDGSGSIRQGEFSQVINFMKQVVASLDLETNKVGVMQYSHWYEGRDWSRQRYMETVIPLGLYTNRIRFEQAADRIVHHGYTTYTAHAINKAVSIDLTASERYLDNCTHKVIIVITDGKSTDAADLSAAANLGRQTGVTLFAVGVRNYRLNELQIIASGQEGNNERVYTTTNFFDLDSIIQILRADLISMITNNDTDSAEAL